MLRSRLCTARSASRVAGNLPRMALRSAQDGAATCRRAPRGGRRSHAELPADEARNVLQRLGEHVFAAARHDRHGLHAEGEQILHRLRPRGDVDRLELDALLREELLHLDAARAAGPPIDLQIGIHGATVTPRTPCLSMVFATSPERFMSSTNSLQVFAPRRCAVLGSADCLLHAGDLTVEHARAGQLLGVAHEARLEAGEHVELFLQE